MPDEDVLHRRLRLSERARNAGGQPISQLMAQALAHPDLISLAAGFVDQASLPNDPTFAALESIFSDPSRARQALQYGNTPGFSPLREAIASRARQADRVLGHDRELAVEQVVVTTGSNQLLHLLIDTLCDPGDIVLCAAPSYFVFLGTLANLGVRGVGVAVDKDGLVPDALDGELSRLHASGELARVKAIYVVSYFDNPCGVSLSAERRPQIVEIARRWSHAGRIHVIEDEAYRELRYAGSDLPSLAAYDEECDTVIVAGTFSKSFSPGIRVGWGILPKDLVGTICEQKGNADFGSPNFSQHLMHRVIEMGLYDKHLEHLCASYRKKLQAMLSAADDCLAPPRHHGVRWIRPEGGLYVWLTLPESIDTGPSGTVFNAAVQAGVLYVPGEYCFPHEGPRRQNTIRLSFGVQPVNGIRAGMKALAGVIDAASR